MVVWEGDDFFAMVVAGPNSRTDFHVNPGEELSLQFHNHRDEFWKVIKIILAQ